MSARLAQFDALLTRRRTSTPTERATPVAPSLRQLRDPWGEPIAEFAHTPSNAELLKAAHRLQSDDWIGVLADDAHSAALKTAWRLALLRADRHGQARVSREVGPQWISAPIAQRPGARPAELRQQLQAAAVQHLWRSGWKLVG